MYDDVPPTITANFVIERKFVAIHNARRACHRSSVEKSPGIRHGTVVRDNLIEIMHNACALNIPDSSAVLTRNYFSRLAFRRACLSRSDKTHALRAERRPCSDRRARNFVRSRHDTRARVTREIFFSQSAFAYLPCRWHNVAIVAGDTTDTWTITPQSGSREQRTMLRNDLHLNARLQSVFFFRPDAKSALRRMPTLRHQHDRTLRFVRFEELNSPPADSCASLFSTCLDITFPFFLLCSDIKSCEWERA